ncbi:hypothetical protein BD311DRAFT_839040 [Dichomitus squalens]|uniref:Uncharacterized protein n=1 Tax=Dichomitus squalens TaxID=114155 RepID=A0A4Q9ML97_9APHY|nr:hypothetical protein BD311DRAFT_839040 [Dichomitus squalens]
MLCTRGTLGDYNQWRALGNDGWGYEDLESYFVRSEKTSGHMFSKYRGCDGVWLNKPNVDPYKTNQLCV